MDHFPRNIHVFYIFKNSNTGGSFAKSVTIDDGDTYILVIDAAGWSNITNDRNTSSFFIWYLALFDIRTFQLQYTEKIAFYFSFQWFQTVTNMITVLNIFVYVTGNNTPIICSAISRFVQLFAMQATGQKK